MLLGIQSRIYFHVMAAFLERSWLTIEGHSCLQHMSIVLLRLLFSNFDHFFFLTVSGHLEYFDGWFYDLFTVFLSCQIPQKRDTVFFFFFPFKIFFGIDWCKVAIITPPSQLEAKTKRICVDMKQNVSGKNMTPILVASHEKCTFIFMFRDVVENHKKKKRLE